MIDNWLDKQTFLRITDTGPESLAEAMWYYLYAYGFKKVPFDWEIARFTQAVGKPVVAIIKEAIRRIITSLKFQRTI